MLAVIIGTISGILGLGLCYGIYAAICVVGDADGYKYGPGESDDG